MPKLTDTQTIILSAGAQRPDNIALPLPKGLHGAAAKMAVTEDDRTRLAAGGRRQPAARRAALA
jgi:hypothetical protein